MRISADGPFDNPRVHLSGTALEGRWRSRVWGLGLPILDFGNPKP